MIEGEFRLGLLFDLGWNVIVFWLDDFMDLYDKIIVKFNLSDSNIDFYCDFVDLVLRYGILIDVNVYGFKICDVLSLFVVFFFYISFYGVFEKFEDL